MTDEPKKVKGSSKEANKGCGSKERTRREAKSEIEVNDTSSSSSTKEKNSQRETEDDEKKKKRSYFRRATEEHEVTELK